MVKQQSLAIQKIKQLFFSNHFAQQQPFYLPAPLAGLNPWPVKFLFI